MADSILDSLTSLQRVFRQRKILYRIGTTVSFGLGILLLWLGASRVFSVPHFEKGGIAILVGAAVAVSLSIATARFSLMQTAMGYPQSIRSCL